MSALESRLRNGLMMADQFAPLAGTSGVQHNTALPQPLVVQQASRIRRSCDFSTVLARVRG